MNLEDKVALDCMAGFTRNPLPERVVWMQSSVTHDRFYWLAVPKDQAWPGQLVIASRKAQEIRIEKAEGVRRLTVLLNDDMLDLDRPVTVSMGGTELFSGVVPRTAGTLRESLEAKGDPRLVFDGAATVQITP
jgi:hypothetical protein